jgi:putative two-component system response regulator
MATAVGDRDTAIRALELGAYAYLIKPFDQNEMLINVAGALERRRLTLISREYEHELEEQVRARTAELRQREEAIVLHLLSAAELRDDETGAHVRRVGLSAAALAEALGWDARAAEDLRLAAPMHDVGKIGIPDAILRKPGPLDPHESDTMQTHAILGARILHDPEVPFLRLAAETARSHHEKWDGTGYPSGLAGEAIPAPGRLVAAVDVYDALTHDRVYRPAMSEDRALALMREGRETHLDPQVFDCFMDCLPELRAIRDRVPETHGR